MNFESVSQVVFSTRFSVAAGHLADQLHPNLTGVLASAHLLANAEAAAIEALQGVLDLRRQTLLGTGIAMRHLAPATAGQAVCLDGWVLRLDDGATPQVDFVVLARGLQEVLAEIELRFAVVERERFLQGLERPRQAKAHRLPEVRPA